MEQALSHDLETVKSVSLTIDLWTSQKQEGYISVTSHFLTRDFAMQNHTLECSHFPGQHTGTAIYQKLCHLTSNWGISLSSTQIPIYVVSDNARNFSSALTGKPVVHLNCVAHNLQLAISDAVAEVGLDSVLKTCRSIVGHYKHSTKSRERLQSIKKKLGLPEHALIQMIDTRWNSTYLMLERLHEQKEAVSADLPNCGKESLTANEWNLIAVYVKILQPLFLATKELCKESVPTLSMVRPIMYSIEGFFKNYVTSKTGVQGSGITLARALQKSLTARFQYIRDSHTHLLSTALDPRFKCFTMENHEIVLAKHLLTEEIRKNKSSLQVGNKCSRKEKVMEEKCASSTSANHSLWGIFDLKSKQTQPAEEDDDSVKKEAHDFLDGAVIGRDEDSLEWWKSCRNYPHLAELAMHYLGIPVTSVASERLFSKAGLTISTRRQNLSSSLVEKLVSLHDVLLFFLFFILFLQIT
ncbi:zinc finger BED domain-containing protein 4-like [Bacillus rossius redtenbacheri]|uniref:zinc finger BED domain-containing protein 4-like n=1 Tax=Bacillus rossius redtenbacheri TaxID=93214 RepID=UPI002FDDB2F8